MTTSPAPAGSTASQRWSQLWYLVFVGNLLFQPVFDPSAGAGHWTLAIVTISVTVALGVTVELREGALRRRSPEVMTVLGLLVTPLNAGASVLFVYAAAYAASYRPARTAYRWMVALSAILTVAFATSVRLTPVPWPYLALTFGIPLLLVWVVGLSCMDDVRRERVSARLRVDNARIEHLATVNERERIARDLHDILGHTLTSVVVRSQLVQRLAATDPQRAIDEASAIEAAARDALSQVRGTVHGWQQADLDQELSVARDALAAADVTLLVERDPALRLAPSVEAAMALSLREAVTNVVRHADAGRCTVTIGLVDGEVTLRVADDGRGRRAPDGGGLTGMRERIVALGGRVDRTVGTGTTLTVAVPVEVAG